MLAELKVNELLEKTAGSDPVPGGGSISALSAALASALAEMVANLTAGNKKYEESWQLMEEIATSAREFRVGFVRDIDADSDAYNRVFDAFKLPKETDEEKAERSRVIQEATKQAAEVPLGVARKARALMDIIAVVAEKGNRNAVTDAAVAVMEARTAVLGAILNVRINLSSIKDEQYVQRVGDEVRLLEEDTIRKEREIIEKVKELL